MALGAITVVESVAGQGPLFIDTITVVGDDNYPSGGSAGFEALYQAAVGAPRTIVTLHQDHDTELNEAKYDHTNDKLFMRVKTTGVESAVSNQSGITYRLVVVSK